MARVDVCPKNLTDVIEASKKLGCGNDAYGNNQYLCLPNVNKTSLVEFCYNGTIGFQEKGLCLQASDGNLTHTSCLGFSTGCPETDFISSDFYKYSACQELNLDHHCYKYDPHCPPKTDVETNDTPTTISILVVCLGLAVVFIVSFCILFFCRRKLRKLCYGKKARNETEQSLLQDGTDDENMPLDPQKTAMITYDEDNQEKNAVSSEKAKSNKGDNTKESDTAEDIKGEETKKETMGSHDVSSDGDTLKEGQGQIKNAFKEIRKCNNTKATTDDVFLNNSKDQGIVECIKSEETKKEAMGSRDVSSDGDTLKERQGQNSKEEVTEEESKKETMGSDDKSSDGDILTERQGQVLDLVKIAVKEIRKCNNTEPTSDDVFFNVIRLMKLAKIFTDNPEMSILELRPACSFLTEVFRENECSLGHIKKLSDQREEYFKLLDDTGTDIWTKAQSYEECLIGANFCFAKIEDHSEDLLDRLRNTFCEKEIAFFLSTLQSEVKKLVSTTEKKAARQATAYVNLFCKIAILHSFVLWQTFCIMNRSVLFQSSSKVVLAMMNRSQNSNLNMLKCITKPEIQNAVFLSVFNITENENVKHFLQIQDIETHLNKRFYERTYKIQWVYSPDVNLKGREFDDNFCGSTKRIDKFLFQYVEGREFDNVCYIRKVSWPSNPIRNVSRPIYHYIGIADDGSCRQCINKSSTFKVKWKLISFGKDERNRRFMVASADWPDRFLYLNSARGCVTCSENRKIDAKTIGKGLWNFSELE